MPIVLDEQAAKSKYKRLRLQVFLTATLGYRLYYVCRLRPEQPSQVYGNRLIAFGHHEHCFRFESPFIIFTVLWGLNGWFQSMGAPPAIISLSRWFSNKDRGTYYGFLSASHNLGESLTYITTALIVSAAGWQWGFVGAGLTGLLGVIFIFFYS